MEWLKPLLRTKWIVVLLLLILVAGVFALLWYFKPSLRPYLIPIGTALAALCAAIPGLTQMRLRWIPAVIGSVLVGLVTGYTAINLQGKLDVKHNELRKIEKRFQFVEKDLGKYICALPSTAKDIIILEAANILREEYRLGNLAHMEDLIRFLLEINRSNGHALYYAGEIKRLRGMRDRSHEDFYKYLEMEAALPEREVGGGISAEVCYQRSKGYCRQRTGWICHLMANDFFKKRLKEVDRNNKRRLFKIALTKVKCALDKFPPGFVQNISTQELKTKLLEELKTLGGKPGA